MLATASAVPHHPHMTKLYHRDVFMPEKIRNMAKCRIPVFASSHAQREASADRYGAIAIPDSLTFSGANIIEAEVVGTSVVKWVIRLPYNAQDDAIFVVTREGCIKTVWRNKRSDTHSTLKAHLYSIS